MNCGTMSTTNKKPDSQTEKDKAKEAKRSMEEEIKCWNSIMELIHSKVRKHIGQIAWDLKKLHGVRLVYMNDMWAVCPGDVDVAFSDTQHEERLLLGRIFYGGLPTAHFLCLSDQKEHLIQRTYTSGAVSLIRPFHVYNSYDSTSWCLWERVPKLNRDFCRAFFLGEKEAEKNKTIQDTGFPEIHGQSTPFLCRLIIHHFPFSRIATH